MSKQDASKLAVFEGKKIRKALHEGEWWFVITDIISALTDAANPSDYWKKMRKRDPDLGKVLQGGGNLSPPLPSFREDARRLTPDAGQVCYPRRRASQVGRP